MLNYQVNKSIDIDSSATELSAFLADFRNWPSWSPWLISEPDCQLDYFGEASQAGSGYRWNGQLVGEGKMELVAISDNRLEMVLSFVRPFKSNAKVAFEFASTPNGCKVNWIMDSKVPWFLFFLKNLFKNMIGMDYDRGLTMLKAKVETGVVESKLELVGDVTLEETAYVSLSGGATLEDMGNVMPGHIAEFKKLVEEKRVEPNGPIFALYGKMNMSTSYTPFDTCMPIKQVVALPEPFKVSTFPKTDAYGVEHTGAYPYLGNAWSMVMTAARTFKVKVKRQPMGIERYLDDPAHTDSKDLRTQVLLLKK